MLWVTHYWYGFSAERFSEYCGIFLGMFVFRSVQFLSWTLRLGRFRRCFLGQISCLPVVCVTFAKRHDSGIGCLSSAVCLLWASEELGNDAVRSISEL